MKVKDTNKPWKTNIEYDNQMPKPIFFNTYIGQVYHVQPISGKIGKHFQLVYGDTRDTRPNRQLRGSQGWSFVAATYQQGLVAY